MPQNRNKTGQFVLIEAVPLMTNRIFYSEP